MFGFSHHSMEALTLGDQNLPRELLTPKDRIDWPVWLGQLGRGAPGSRSIRFMHGAKTMKGNRCLLCESANKKLNRAKTAHLHCTFHEHPGFIQPCSFLWCAAFQMRNVFYALLTAFLARLPWFCTCVAFILLGLTSYLRFLIKDSDQAKQEWFFKQKVSSWWRMCPWESIMYCSVSADQWKRGEGGPFLPRGERVRPVEPSVSIP